MRKLNIIGLIVFFIVLSLTLWLFSKDSGDNIRLLEPLLFILTGIAIIGVDRWAGDSKYGVFPVALLWMAYWGVVAYGFLSITGLYAFMAGFGHGSEVNDYLIYAYGATTIIFAALSLSNIIKFLLALFSLPKLQN